MSNSGLYCLEFPFIYLFVRNTEIVIPLKYPEFSNVFRI